MLSDATNDGRRSDILVWAVCVAPASVLVVWVTWSLIGWLGSVGGGPGPGGGSYSAAAVAPAPEEPVEETRAAHQTAGVDAADEPEPPQPEDSRTDAERAADEWAARAARGWHVMRPDEIIEIGKYVTAAGHVAEIRNNGRIREVKAGVLIEDLSGMSSWDVRWGYEHPDGRILWESERVQMHAMDRSRQYMSRTWTMDHSGVVVIELVGGTWFVEMRAR